jgi:hypothetical protein
MDSFLYRQFPLMKSVQIDKIEYPYRSGDFSFTFSTKFQGKKLKIRMGKSRTGTKQKVVLNE